MPTGVVKWYNTMRKFGFITPDDGGEDLYFPQKEIKIAGVEELKEGQKVQFTVTAGKKGKQVSNIQFAQ
jgi:cold shock protein